MVLVKCRACEETLWTSRYPTTAGFYLGVQDAYADKVRAEIITGGGLSAPVQDNFRTTSPTESLTADGQVEEDRGGNRSVIEFSHGVVPWVLLDYFKC